MRAYDLAVAVIDVKLAASAANDRSGSVVPLFSPSQRSTYPAAYPSESRARAAACVFSRGGAAVAVTNFRSLFIVASSGPEVSFRVQWCVGFVPAAGRLPPQAASAAETFHACPISALMDRTSAVVSERLKTRSSCTVPKKKRPYLLQ